MSRVTGSRLLFFFTAIAGLALVQSPGIVWLLQVVATHEQAQLWAASLRSSVPGVVLALLVAFYIDVIRGEIARREQEQVLNDMNDRFSVLEEALRLEPLSRISPTDLFLEGVRRHLGPEAPRVDSLVASTFGPEGTVPTFDYSAELIFRGSDSEDFYEVDIRVVRRQAMSEHTVAIVADDEPLRDYLMRNSPRINNVYYYGSSEDLDQVASSVAATLRISYVPRGRPLARRQTLTPEEIRDPELQAFIPSDMPIDGTRFRLLLIEIPPTDEPLILTFTMRCPWHLFGFYWAMPEITYVNHITFDMRALRPDRPLNFYMTPFMGCASEAHKEAGGRLRRLEIDNWVPCGGGVQLTWASAIDARGPESTS